MSIQLHMTPQALEARRLNARRSTGPRTEQGKRHSARNLPRGRGFLAWPRRSASPPVARESETLLVGLLEAFKPANPAERVLVEELARLHRRKERNQEAQDGLIQAKLRALRRERSKHQQALTLESPNAPYRLAAVAGWFEMADSPAKFREVSRLLNVLKEDIELGNFSAEGAGVLETIYGPDPSIRGARVLADYKRLLASSFRRPAGEAEQGSGSLGAEGGDLSPSAASPTQNTGARREPSGDSLHLELTQGELVRAISEEQSLLAAKHRAYIEEHIPSTLALRRAALIPEGEGWHPLLQQDQVLDRQIERKTRLLLFMQWVRRQRRRLYRHAPKARK
jgi:hypothetical protein